MLSRRARGSRASRWKSSSAWRGRAAPTEPSRETKTSQLKKLFRAREKVAVDYGGRGERLRDVLRASIVCETVAELQTLGDELGALEAAGTVKVLQIKNRFRGIRRRRGIATSTSASSTTASSPSCRFTSGRSCPLPNGSTSASMPVQGVLEPPVENTTCTASVRRQGVTYLVARMVPAALSVVIGWLYVDAFVFKGANLIVKRADLLPTRGFGTYCAYSLILAAWANAFLLAPPVSFNAACENARRGDVLWIRRHAVCLEDLLLPNLRGGPAVLRKNTPVPHLVVALRLPAGHMYKKLRKRP